MLIGEVFESKKTTAGVSGVNNPLPSLQVQEVLQFHRGLPGEELHAAPADGAAAQTSLHPGPAQREAGPHTTQRPHRPDQEEEGRERYVWLFASYHFFFSHHFLLSSQLW